MAVLHVACGADERYAPHAAAMLHSLHATSPGLIAAHLLHPPGLSRRARERLAPLAELVEVPDERIAGLPEMVEISTAMWYRILLPDLLEADTVLYLDVDTLALGSLAPLAEIDVSGVYLAAVENVWEPWMTPWPGMLGLPERQGYFNSGVVLLNLDALRADGCAQRLREVALSAELRYPDQDALNLVLGGRRAPLHPRFNAMNSVMEFGAAADVLGAEAVAEARADPVIRHFEGPGANKPWHRRCPYPERAAYWEHRRAAWGRGYRRLGRT